MYIYWSMQRIPINISNLKHLRSTQDLSEYHTSKPATFTVHLKHAHGLNAVEQFVTRFASMLQLQQKAPKTSSPHLCFSCKPTPSQAHQPRPSNSRGEGGNQLAETTQVGRRDTHHTRKLLV